MSAASPGALWRFARDADGSVASISAIVIVAAVGSAALAVDSSAFFVQKRKLQSAVDMAAMAAVAGGQSATTAASTSLAANRMVPATLSVTTGTYAADPARSAATRYVAGVAGNAASVSATIYAPMLLGRVFGLAMDNAPAGMVAISASGRAAALPLAAFALGSRVAGLNGGVSNAVLSALTGGSVNLQLADYQSLASAKVDVGVLLQSVAARIGGSSGTYADVLGAKVPLSTVLSVLQSSGLDTKTAAAIASVIAALPSSSGTVVLGNLVNLGTSSTLAISSKLPVSVTMSAYDVLSQAAELANAGRTSSVINLGAAVPGIADASLSVTVGPTGPTTAIAPYATTTTVTTSQVRIFLSTSANVLGLGFVTLPIVLDLGAATATTPGPSCASGGATLGLAVTPSASTLTIGVPTSGSTAVAPAPVVSLLGLTVAASGSASAGSSTKLETFVASDIAAGTVKTATSSASSASLLTSALGSLKLSVGGVPLSPLLPLAASVTSALATLATPSATILDEVARSLGVGIGQADTWITDLRCGSPVLVQ